MTGASEQATSEAGQLADRAYTGYVGNTVAPLSGNEQSAYNIAGTTASNAQKSGLEAQANTPYSTAAVNAFAQPYINNVLTPQQQTINQTYQGKQQALNDNPLSVAAQNAYDRQGNSKNNTALNNEWNADTSNMQTTALNNAFNYGQGALAENTAQAQGIENQNGAALSETGKTQQGIQQAQDTFDYGQYLAKQHWSTNNLQTLLTAIGGARGNTSSTGTGSGGQSSNNLGSLIGTAASVVGTIASFY